MNPPALGTRYRQEYIKPQISFSVLLEIMGCHSQTQLGRISLFGFIQLPVLRVKIWQPCLVGRVSGSEPVHPLPLFSTPGSSSFLPPSFSQTE